MSTPSLARTVRSDEVIIKGQLQSRESPSPDLTSQIEVLARQDEAGDARILRVQIEEKERIAEALSAAHAAAQESVRAQTAEIHAVNNRLQVEMAERLVAERERQQALEREQSANRAKDRFLAVLSHELRTPLSPVLMTITAMETDPDLPARLRADVIMIRRNIELEVKLIDDLLDLSRVTSGKLRLQLQSTRVHDLLQHIVRNAASDLAGKSLTLHTQYDARNDLVRADPARLQQVFWNLLRNATKFTPDGGEINIRTWNDDGASIRIEVRDTGVGIGPDILPRLFQAFEQGDITVTQQFGGLGLGLSISKTLLEMHGGTISAASAGRGCGTTLTVTIPSSDAAAARIEEEQKTIAVSERAQVRLLLVEDHVDTGRVLGRLLGRSGCVVEVARTIESALRLAASMPFDIVVSDIGLLDGTGHKLIRELKCRYGLKGIALSGYGMEEDICKSLEAGFAEHLVKPVTITQLRDAIQRVLAQEHQVSS